MNRVGQWTGGVRTTCERCSSPAWFEPARSTFAETLQLILDVYADEAVTRLLATSFTSVFRRALIFHLAQAGLSIQCFREIARLLRSRLGE